MGMTQDISPIKGIHPGKIIGRELKKRNLSQRKFADSIHEHSQTLNAVITGHRGLTVEMAVKIEDALGFEEGYLLTLQVFYEIAHYRQQVLSDSVQGIPAVRKILFWDTDFDSIDWGRHKNYVIGRVLEMGNDEEIREITRFYRLSSDEILHYKHKNNYSVKS